MNFQGPKESWGFPGDSVVKNLPAKQEMWAVSLGREDPLEKEMATHSSILAWRIPWPEEPGGLQSMGSQRVGHDLAAEMQPQGEPGQTYFFLQLLPFLSLSRPKCGAEKEGPASDFSPPYSVSPIFLLPHLPKPMPLPQCS